MRTLIMALTIWLAGCSAQRALECSVEDLEHDALSLAGVIVPAPADMQSPESITIYRDRVELSLADWETVIAWQHELDRYMRDLRGTWLDTLATVDAHNAQYAVPPPKEPEKRSWWKFWKKEDGDED